MCKKLLSILVLSVLAASTLVDCAPSTLTILSITEGNVFVMKAGTGNWIEAQVGMSLEPGDSVKTGDNSSAKITFFEGSTMELEAGTEIEIGSLDISRDTDSTTIILEQTIGSIIFRVTKIVDPASRYEVETPAGVVAVRGSIMQVNVIEDGTTWATNLEGDIWAVAQGVELQVPQGQQCIISPGQPPTLTVSFVQMTNADVESLDPAWGWDTASGEQVQYIYETLLLYDGGMTDRFVPSLATEWIISTNGKTIRFKIREGVKFHEGGDLTASDVKYSFERAMVQDRSAGPIWMFYQPLLGLFGSRDLDGNIMVTFSQIDNAVEVDGDWVVFHLSDPAWHLAFLQILCGPWASMVDKEWCVAHGEWDGTEETWRNYNNRGKAYSYLYNHTNGTGPWKLEQWDPGVQTKLVRNDEYWRGPAAFERIITQRVQEWTTRKQALLAGDADLIYVPRDCIAELEGIADLRVYGDLPELSFNAFSFNMAINPDSTYIGSGTLDGEGIPADFFTDLDVRKGFNYAFDWATYIKDALAGEGKQMGSPVIEGLPFYNPNASMYSRDLAKAEEHLKVAWDGEVWEKGFRFTLLYNTGNLAGETACKILTENLAAINPKFQVSILPMNWATGIFPGIKSGFLPMFQIGWIPDYPHPDNVVVPFMASYGVIAEWQGYGYPELDQLIEEAFKELDPAVQQDMYYEIQERYYEDAPSIMLCQPLSRRYFTKYIHGFYFNPAIASYAGPLYYMSKSSS
jgi:peptide/nickel transport system substrate-binding protein